MDLLPSVPRAALLRPCHLLHGRPAAKSTPARCYWRPRSVHLAPLAAALGGEAWKAWITSAAKRRQAATRVVVGVVAGYPPTDFGTTTMAAFGKSLSFATFSTDTVPEPIVLVPSGS